jgi:hypothetical protein
MCQQRGLCSALCALQAAIDATKSLQREEVGAARKGGLTSILANRNLCTWMQSLHPDSF